MTHLLFPVIGAPREILKSSKSVLARYGGAGSGILSKAIRSLWVVAGLWKLSVSALALSSVSVGWDANPENDIKGYKVYLGTATGEYSVVQDVTNGTTAVLSELSEGTTYYCAVQAYNVGGEVSEMSAEISFVASAAITNFETWASAGGLSGASALPSAIPFNDGVPNLLKYAFNMDSAAPDVRTLSAGSGTEGLPVFSVDTTGGQPKFRVEYLRRIGSGLSYSPKSSTDLVNYEPMSGETTVMGIDANWERVVVETNVDLTTSPQLFGRVEVTMP